MSDAPPMLPFALLAGGLGTRLGELTRSSPKALIPVAGEPFIAHQLRLLESKGVRKVVLCTGHRATPIQDFVGDGSRFGVHVTYSLDGPQLLGTGGALRKALPFLGESFAVLYGDSYLDTDYAAVVTAFQKSARPALMTVFRNEDRWDKSNALFKDGIVARYDKRQPTPEMAYIDYGLNFLRADTLKGRSPSEPFDIADVFTELAARGDLSGFEVTERFYEIGSPEGLAETEAFLGRTGHGLASRTAE